MAVLLRKTNAPSRKEADRGAEGCCLWYQAYNQEAKRESRTALIGRRVRMIDWHYGVLK
jgi:hypothetical protein